MMTVAANQPYFMPYAGFFKLLDAADLFVVSDDYAFMKRSWIYRNNIIGSDGDASRFVLSVENKSDSRLISEHRYSGRDFDKFRERLRHSYHRAPQFGRVTELIDEIFATGELNVARLNRRSLELTARYVGLDTRFVYSSEVEGLEKSKKAQDRVIDLCRVLGAERYVNAIGGTALYRREDFAAQGVELRFIDSLSTPYRQCGRAPGDFLDGLSIIDMLMNCPPQEVREMLRAYRLV